MIKSVVNWMFSSPQKKDSQTGGEKRPREEIEQVNDVKKLKQENEDSFDEKRVGLGAYVNPNTPAFTAILKHRYTDFHVNEMDSQGNVVHLTSFEIPQAQIPSLNDTVNDAEELKDEDGIEELGSLLNDSEVAENVKALLDSSSSSSAMSKPIEGKETRTAVHRLIRKYFDGRLETKTGAESQIEFCRINQGKRGGKKGKRIDHRREEQSAAMLGGAYLHFTLYKENKDTMQAIDAIARNLKRPNKLFSYAGTKDKRAVTCQRISAHKLTAQKLKEATKRIPWLRVGNFSYEPQGLKLGDLKGNGFCIVLREVTGCNPKDIDRALISLRDHGFLNYYGMQRFGTRQVKTFEIGKLLLVQDWKGAIDLILGHRGEDPQSDIGRAAAHWLEHRNPQEALKLYPRHFVAERAILSAYDKQKNQTDHYSAILSVTIPRNLRSMYIHAYQSLVWNSMVTERVQLYGLEPVVGDIVLLGDDTEEEPVIDAAEDAPLLEVEVADKQDQVATERLSELKQKTKVLETMEECRKYSIFDVVLPLPGHAVTYPQNDMLQAYKSFMAKDGFDPLNMKSKNFDTNLPGAYRKIVAKPKFCEWEWTRYEEPDQQLVLTDLGKLSGRTLKKNEEGTHLALILKLALGSSQYATMALREAMKSETSAHYHTQLSTKRNQKYQS